MEEHIPGKPKYERDDIVSFKTHCMGEEYLCEGEINIIDDYGAWEIENPREPSYDIIVRNWRGNGSPCLVKHVRESKLTLIKKGKENQ